MPEGEKNELLQKIVDNNPSLVFNIVQQASSQPGGYHPAPNADVPKWCICTRCREMPTDPEKLCCERQPNMCISQLADFKVLVLNETVLALARAYRRDVLAVDDGDDINKSNRHASYRQFVLWQHGVLGAGNRRVIPSCCVWAIRDKYPDPFAQYTGFIPSRLS
ncbi:P2X purinoceptor 7-like [Ptychodera flava]|uniref:P2X purinoceptor 7-like n=1 Tax=Ptychodera flava TaxID=63121 RepID=UPI00396A3EE3